ncbi:hypothetical protein LMTR3_11505 [Bradyrhizobium sp. LMTR 3]|nr:hypothetical protein LMTR3_11505 [Bradyrhizobium sp. LMTR 3]
MAGKRSEVLDALLSRNYDVPRAKEFAAHGVSRRLKTMSHCIEKVFATLPPEREDHPSMEELIDAVIHIQAFTFNAFACLDNLAWIWVCEQKLTTDKGEEIPPTKIGLGRKCRIVRRSLPADFQKHLKSLDGWFDHLENFRHALAHRIPLYIPPAAIREQDVPKYELLEKQMAKAHRRRNYDRYEKLKAEQQALTKYQPEMMHSPEDNSKRIVFHPQLLSDFGTVCDLAQRLNSALDSEPKSTVERKFWTGVFSLKKMLARAASLFRRA